MVSVTVEGTVQLLAGVTFHILNVLRWVRSGFCTKQPRTKPLAWCEVKLVLGAWPTPSSMNYVSATLV